jgi:hypothetical protein
MNADTFIVVSLVWFSIKAVVTAWCLIIEDNYYPRKLEVSPQFATLRLVVSLGFIVWLGLIVAKVV